MDNSSARVFADRLHPRVKVDDDGHIIDAAAVLEVGNKKIVFHATKGPEESRRGETGVAPGAVETAGLSEAFEAFPPSENEGLLTFEDLLPRAKSLMISQAATAYQEAVLQA